MPKENTIKKTPKYGCQGIASHSEQGANERKTFIYTSAETVNCILKQRHQRTITTLSRNPKRNHERDIESVRILYCLHTYAKGAWR